MEENLISGYLAYTTADEFTTDSSVGLADTGIVITDTSTGTPTVSVTVTVEFVC